MGRLRAGVLIGTVLQIVPTAVIVITDTVPSWACWTLGVWLVLWALLVLAKGTAADR